MENEIIKDCACCKHSDTDYIYDSDEGEEYKFYICEKDKDTSLDYECDCFKKGERH